MAASSVLTILLSGTLSFGLSFVILWIGNVIKREANYKYIVCAVILLKDWDEIQLSKSSEESIKNAKYVNFIPRKLYSYDLFLFGQGEFKGIDCFAFLVKNSSHYLVLIPKAEEENMEKIKNLPSVQAYIPRTQKFLKKIVPTKLSWKNIPKFW